LDAAIKIITDDAFANPPLFYVFAYIWMRIIPYGTAWVKLLCIIITFFGIFFCGMNAKRIKGDNAAVLACLFAGASAFLTRNAALGFRAYALVFLLVNALLWFYIKRLQDMGREKTSHIVKYGVVMALLMYTHYYGCLVAVVFFFADVYLFFRKKISWRCVFSYIGAGAVFLPWFILAVIRIIERNGVLLPVELSLRAVKTVFFSLLCDSKLLVAVLFATPALLIIKKSLPGIREDLNDTARFIVVICSLVCLSVIAVVYLYSAYINPSGSFFVTRYFISVLPMAVIVAAVGVEHIFNLVFYNHPPNVKNMGFLTFFLCAAVYMGADYFSAINEAPYQMNNLYEPAIEWVYAQEAAHASDSLFLTTYNNGSERGVWYYVTHKGSRPPINYASNWFITPEELAGWNRIYRHDIHDPLSVPLKAVLEQQYDLVDAYAESGVLVYQRRSN
jgi:uncharacterized membrane protein